MAMAASNLHSIATDRPVRLRNYSHFSNANKWIRIWIFIVSHFEWQVAQGTQVKYFSKKNGRWCTAEVARVDKDIIELKVKKKIRVKENVQTDPVQC